ncbi:MAG: hypothetical protein EPN55_05800 [Gammaproteobacteria bacterium]|nr:MAG: hypothetical protein EPN55_05800 [Gammaproteobacteria bacterium]
MITKTKQPKPNAMQLKLLALYRVLVDYVFATLAKAKPGTLAPSFLAVVRLIVKDAGIMREVRTRAQAQQAMEALRGEVKDVEKALSLPFAPPAAKQ